MTASPLSTGAAGPHFETEVGAHYLAGLLTGSAARATSIGTVVEVGLQRAATGSPLDDVIVHVDTPAGRRRLDIQVKRRVKFTRRDTEFAAVLEAAWDTLTLPSFAEVGNLVGVALEQLPDKARAHYVRVPAWAQQSPNAADFFDRTSITRFASEEMREFVETVRAVLLAYAARVARAHGEDVAAATQRVTDERIWELCRRFVIIDFDFDIGLASRDRAMVLETLRQVAPGGDLSGARALYDRLIAAVNDAAESGGGFTAETLRDRLRTEGTQLRAALDCARDVGRLDAHSELVLESIRTNIAGMTVNRTDVANEIVQHVDSGAAVVLTGSPGVGKSALLRGLMEQRRGEGPTIALSGERLLGVSGWSGFASQLGLDCSLRDLVSQLSGSTRPCLLIDGIDRAEDAGSRLVINDLLAAIARMTGPGGEPRWSIVMTARATAWDTVRQWMHVSPRAGSAPRRLVEVRVAELNEEEVAAMTQRLPHLRAVLESPGVGSVVRNLFLLGIVEQFTATDVEGAPRLGQRGPMPPATESDVLLRWWEDIVGRDAARDRQAAILAVGERVLRERVSRDVGTEVDSSLLRDLERDGVLHRDTGTDTYSFGHDILADWAATRALAHHPNPIEFLRTLGDPFWARPAVELLACWRLERDGYAAWRALLAQAETPPPRDADGAGEARATSTHYSEETEEVDQEEDASRTAREVRHPAAASPWAEAILTAPLRSGRLAGLLCAMAPALLEEEGARLGTLLRALRTRFVRPDPRLDALLSVTNVPDAERADMLLEQALPFGPAWTHVLGWLVPRLATLPRRARPEASQVMLHWQRLGVTTLPFRREITEAALAWRAVLMPANDDRSGRSRLHVPRELSPFYDRLREIVALGVDTIPDRAAVFLDGLLVTDSKHQLQRWVARAIPAQLIKHAPHPFVNFVLDILVPDWHLSDEERVCRLDAERVVWSGSSDEDPMWEHLRHSLGSAFLHPSHMTGPFLALLVAHPDEGLRLVGTLVNHATASYLRDQALNGAHPPAPVLVRPLAASPVPSTLTIAPQGPEGPMGPQVRTAVDPQFDTSAGTATASPDASSSATTSLHESADRVSSDADGHAPAGAPSPTDGSMAPSARAFHGDGLVYQWFRPNGNAPYPVRAALMALEVWMEHQLDAGRDPEALFDVVLADSTSVATLGVLVAMALGHPAKCLRAAAPLVITPLLWEYDIARRASDQHGTFDVTSIIGREDPSLSLLRERDARPQRRAEIRELMAQYVARPELPTSVAVLAAVRAFATDLSPLTESERARPATVAAHRNRTENFAA